MKVLSLICSVLYGFVSVVLIYIGYGWDTWPFWVVMVLTMMIGILAHWDGRLTP